MELCEIHEQTYDPDRYESCYMCFLERRPIYVDCVTCGKIHNARFAVCFACQQIPGREKHGKRLKLEILGRDGFRCGSCGSADGDMQVDHIRPLGQGGTLDPWNLRAICEDCKHAKRRNPRAHSRARMRLVQAYQTYLWSYLSSDEQRRVVDEPTEVEPDEIATALAEHRGRPTSEPTEVQRRWLQLWEWRGRPVNDRG